MMERLLLAGAVATLLLLLLSAAGGAEARPRLPGEAAQLHAGLHRHARHHHHHARHYRGGARHLTQADGTPFPPQPVYYYQTKYFNVPLDNFNFEQSTFFPMKYLVNDTFWKRPTLKDGEYVGGGPIFFYTGNEGPIELFAQNTGFMWDIMAEFEAMVVFAEHRYYGTTMPFGNDTYSDAANLQYLTSEQALADYALFLDFLKGEYRAWQSPIVAFGGSYGGMLAAWFRIKYPHVVAGAIASSAPIWQFTNLTGPEVYNGIVTRTFNNSGPNCASGILKSWAIMKQMGQSESGLRELSSLYNLCTPLRSPSDVANLLFPWIYNAFSTLAMGDYPYAATFLGPLPGYPVKAACAFFKHATTDSEIVQAVYQASNVYYNYTGALPCANLSDADIGTLQDAGGWAYQSCTEMVMPLGQDGIHDMFYSQPWNLAWIVGNCTEQYDGVVPRPDWIRNYYGGHNIRDSTNIVFANGNLDPWSGGGVLQSLAPTLVALEVEGGAHHLDLRGSNPKDPASVIEVRKKQREWIRAWIKQAESSPFDTDDDCPGSSSSSGGHKVRRAVLISVFVTAGVSLLLAALYMRSVSKSGAKTTNGYAPM